VNFRADGSDDQRREKHRRRQRHPQPFARHRRAIGVVKDSQLLVRKDRYG
jgi:hypothetical protein